MNVLVIGGAEVFLLRKIAKLRQKGHYAVLAYCEERGEGIRDVVERYLGSHGLYKITYDFSSIVPIIQQLQINVVHAVEGHPRFLQTARNIDPGIITLTTQTASVWDADQKFDHRVYTDAVVTMAHEFLRIVKAKLQHPPVLMVVIENGVKTDRHSAGLGSGARRKTLLGSIGLSDPVKIVLQLARINPIKNITASLHIAQKVCSVRNDCYFLVVGGHRGELSCEKYFQELLQLRRDLKLDDKVMFLGERSDAERFIAASDCVVCTTVAHEGTPNALLEAMASEKPIVAFDCPGIRDVVLDGETGFVAPAGDADQFAEKLERIVGNPLLGSALGQAGKRLANSKFDLDRAVNEYERLYYELLASKKKTFMQMCQDWCARAQNLFQGVCRIS